MNGRALLLACLGVVAIGCAAFAAIAYHPAIGKIRPPVATGFEPAVVARGAELAAIGDCAVCHTEAHSPRLSGGRGVPTPFGTIYATNITPDVVTGIGTWSEVAFRRAMRDGIARDGSHLYPVLPYPHFTRATDADIAALYAYLMTRDQVHATAPANHLPFPLDQRVLLAGWNLLFLRPGPWQPDPAHDATWNRGAYLVEAIGHCGACHTPHNALGAEEKSDRFAGGEAEGWWAPPLQASSPARVPWTETQLAGYLRTGFAAEHGAAAGPMTAVTEQLSGVPDADIHAIATYIASLMPKAPKQESGQTGPGTEAGQALFDGACAACHGSDAPMTRAGLPSLGLATGVNAPTPQALVNIIVHGIPWRSDGRSTRYMPAFGPALTDAQIAELAAYVRAHYTGKPAWTGIADQISKARKSAGAS